MAVADGNIDKDEASAIFEALDTDGMSEAAKTKIHSFLIEPPRFSENLDVLAGGSPELRYGVMVLLTEVALSDGDFAEGEKALLDQARSKLSITTEQLAAIETFVREVQRIRVRGIDDNVAVDALKQAAAGLGAVGVPDRCGVFLGDGDRPERGGHHVGTGRGGAGSRHGPRARGGHSARNRSLLGSAAGCSIPATLGRRGSSRRNAKPGHNWSSATSRKPSI